MRNWEKVKEIEKMDTGLLGWREERGKEEKKFFLKKIKNKIKK